MVGWFLSVLLYGILILFIIPLFFYYLLIYFSIRSTDLFFVSQCILHRLLASFKLTAAQKMNTKDFSGYVPGINKTKYSCISFT